MTTTLTTIARRITAQQEVLKADPPTLANVYGDPRTAIIYRPGAPHVYAGRIEVGTVQIVGTYRGVTALYTLDVGVSVRSHEDGPTLRYTLSSYAGPELLHGQTASPPSMTDAHERYVRNLAAQTLGVEEGERITYTRTEALAAFAHSIAPGVRRKAREAPDSALSWAVYGLRNIDALDAIVKHATGPTITDADLDTLARKIARDALKDIKREASDALAKLG